jgi:integrase/recombinase XerC
MTASVALIRGRGARAALPAPLTIAAGRKHTAATILRAWFEGKAEHTIRSYRLDLEDFALYFSRALAITPPMGVPDALARLFKQSAPSAHEIVLAFRSYLGSAHLSAATINRHLATLRSVTKLGRMLGMMAWCLEVPGLKAERRRHVAGPTVDDVRALLAATSGDSEAETRDAAIVVTFYCLGLRVSELCGLTLEATDLVRGNTWILGKGRRERELVPLPAAGVTAVQRYLVYRGTGPGPLFQVRRRGKHRAGALETRSVLRIVRRLGQRVGLHTWCHGLRHTSITQAIALGQRAGLGLDKIRAHSRHRTIATLMLYNDEHDRQGTQKTLADLVASTLRTKTEGGA